MTPAQYKADIAALFDSLAAGYDQVGPAFFAAIGRALVDWVGVSAGAAVLDVACGRGAALLPAAERAGSTGRAVGVDLSERMIARLAETIDAGGMSTTTVAVMDGEKLAFEDATFDRVLCSMSLGFFPSPHAGLLEMRRVLKPEGRAAVSVFRWDDPWWNFLVRLAQPYASEMAPAPSIESDRPVYAFDRPAILSAMLEQAGFSDVEVGCFEADAVFADEDEWWRSLSTHGARELLDLMPRHVRRQFKADAVDALQALKGPAGISLPVRVILTSGARAD